MPNRNEEKLEITPPVYNFLLYFLDQNKLDGPKFLLFDRLGQYKDYKLNLLYCHFGVFNKEYIEIKRKLEVLMRSDFFQLGSDFQLNIKR